LDKRQPQPWPGRMTPQEPKDKVPPSAGARARAAAARAVQAVIGRGRSLTEVLEQMDGLDQDRDRPLVQELSYGTLRLLPRLRAIASQLLNKPLKPEEGDLEALIFIGLYQLLATRIPPHAAVASSVAATRVLEKGWAAKLVNALLRRFQREREALLAEADKNEEARWLFPLWLLDRLKTAWPADWPEIIEASNTQAPLCLRVNRLVSDRDAYLQRLAAAGIAAQPAPQTPMGLVPDLPLPMARLPGFADGQVSVQDANAQLAAPLLAALPGERVLDACAAPGGKTAHLLELADGRLDLTALDIDPHRLDRVRDNLQRLSLTARLVPGDAAEPCGDWAQVSYDRILLDVPCSATGVIRRHPDIKWLRRPGDIEALCARQARMLDALWPLLAPGGTLVYVTCSLLPDENERQIRAFLSRHGDAAEIPIAADWGLERTSGRQTLPAAGGGDGFYFARLVKATP
jgi:16S rRNA (cytosine967-C5)-methyltransferase